MTRLEFTARQSADPRGVVGRVVAHAMSIESASANERVLLAVDPKPGDPILGFGSDRGRALGCVAQHIESGRARQRGGE